MKGLPRSAAKNPAGIAKAKFDIGWQVGCASRQGKRSANPGGAAMGGSLALDEKRKTAGDKVAAGDKDATATLETRGAHGDDEPVLALGKADEKKVAMKDAEPAGEGGLQAAQAPGGGAGGPMGVVRSKAGLRSFSGKKAAVPVDALAGDEPVSAPMPAEPAESKREMPAPARMELPKAAAKPAAAKAAAGAAAPLAAKAGPAVAPQAATNGSFSGGAVAAAREAAWRPPIASTAKAKRHGQP